jgi:hypothetical protein
MIEPSEKPRKIPARYLKLRKEKAASGNGFYACMSLNIIFLLMPKGWYSAVKI